MRVSCPQVNKLKEAYVDGLLRPDTRVAVESHAAGCNLCRGRIALAYKVKAGMSSAVRFALGKPAPSNAQLEAIHTRLEQRITRTPGVWLGRSSFAVAMLTLVLITATVVGAMKFDLINQLLNLNHVPEPIPVPNVELRTPVVPVTPTPIPTLELKPTSILEPTLNALPSPVSVLPKPQDITVADTQTEVPGEKVLPVYRPQDARTPAVSSNRPAPSGPTGVSPRGPGVSPASPIAAPESRGPVIPVPTAVQPRVVASTATRLPVRTPLVTSTPWQTRPPLPTLTALETRTPSGDRTPLVTRTPQPTRPPLPTGTPPATHTPLGTVTATGTGTPQPTHTSTATRTPPPTRIPAPSRTPFPTWPPPTPPPSRTPYPTRPPGTPFPTHPPEPTGTHEPCQWCTPGPTWTPRPTRTPMSTPTPKPTYTPTLEPTQTDTPPPEGTSEPTDTPTMEPTAEATQTASP